MPGFTPAHTLEADLFVSLSPVHRRRLLEVRKKRSELLRSHAATGGVERILASAVKVERGAAWDVEEEGVGQVARNLRSCQRSATTAFERLARGGERCRGLAARCPQDGGQEHVEEGLRVGRLCAGRLCVGGCANLNTFRACSLLLRKLVSFPVLYGQLERLELWIEYLVRRHGARARLPVDLEADPLLEYGVPSVPPMRRGGELLLQSARRGLHLQMCRSRWAVH